MAVAFGFLLSLIWLIFCIYFFVKVVSFVVNAPKQYKSMIERQNVIISLLLDIRDNAKGTDRDNVMPLLYETNNYTSTNYSPHRYNYSPPDMPSTNGEIDLIIQTYKALKFEYGESLSDEGIALKLENELKVNPASIMAAIAKAKQTD